MPSLTIDRLSVQIFPDRAAMGAAAAGKAAEVLRQTLAEKGEARVITASAPSQDEFLDGLVSAPGIDWGKITLFHMDEYLGLPADHPATFRTYQRQHLLSRVRARRFEEIRGECPDSAAEAARYAALLGEAPIDLVCMGIGENGHVAFNDPPVADFNDPWWVKRVELDEMCRQQQVNDGCFPDLAAVPRQALTLTCPALMSGKVVVCVVPGRRKAAAVRDTLEGPISPACPASVLRRHPCATLFLDADAAASLGTAAAVADGH